MSLVRPRYRQLTPLHPKDNQYICTTVLRTIAYSRVWLATSLGRRSMGSSVGPEALDERSRERLNFYREHFLMIKRKRYETLDTRDQGFISPVFGAGIEPTRASDSVPHRRKIK